MTASRSSSVLLRRAWLALAGVSGAAYVLSAYWPPVDPTQVGEATFFTRQFPGVPPAWVIGRLLALTLAIGAFLVAPAPARPSAMRRAPAPHSPVRPRLQYGALAIAAILCIAGWSAQHLGAIGELLFIVALPLPALATYLAHRRPGRWRADPSIAFTLGIFALWTLMRMLLPDHDARAATPVDTWANLKALAGAVTRGGDLLTGRFEPGVSDLLHLLCGASLLRALEWTPTLAWMQTVNAVWLAAATLALHGLALRIVGAPAAGVAAAAFLFAPATLMLPLTAMPLAIPLTFAVTLFLLFDRLHSRHSPTALVGLATVGGAAIGLGHAVPIAGCLALATAWLLWNRRRLLDAATLATACLACVAIALPLLPDVDTLNQMRAQYLNRFLPWQLVEAVLLGQRSPFALVDVSTLQRPWENAMTALLSPVLSARTPLRLWGDTFVEPIAALLAVAGSLLALRRGVASELRLPLVYAVVALLPGLTSSYDRPSLIRVVALPAMLSVLAAGGFGHLIERYTRSQQWLLAIVCSGVLITSGTWIFDHVNPRIVAQSWVTIAIDATRASDDVVLLDFHSEHPIHYLHVAAMATQVPEHARRTLEFRDAESLRTAAPSATPTFLWSPGLEEVEAVSLHLCRTWPSMRRFHLRDVAGVSLALAASADDSWRPALPASRWRELPACTVHMGEGGSPKSTRKTPQDRP